MQRDQTLQSIKFIDAPYLHVFTNPAICVITTLKYYLAGINPNQLAGINPNQLVFQKPHYPVSEDTIAQWTSVVLFEATVDVAFFQVHSLQQNRFLLIN